MLSAVGHPAASGLQTRGDPAGNVLGEPAGGGAPVLGTRGPDLSAGHPPPPGGDGHRARPPRWAEQQQTTLQQVPASGSLPAAPSQSGCRQDPADRGPHTRPHTRPPGLYPCAGLPPGPATTRTGRPPAPPCGRLCQHRQSPPAPKTEATPSPPVPQAPVCSCLGTRSRPLPQTVKAEGLSWKGHCSREGRGPARSQRPGRASWSGRGPAIRAGQPGDCVASSPSQAGHSQGRRELFPRGPPTAVTRPQASCGGSDMPLSRVHRTDGEPSLPP